MSETRKLATILIADVVGYSPLAGYRLGSYPRASSGPTQRHIDPAIAAHHGRIVKRAGDLRAYQRGLTRPQLIQADEAVYPLRVSASDQANAKGGGDV